jgi:hypothetical protein
MVIGSPGSYADPGNIVHANDANGLVSPSIRHDQATCLQELRPGKIA